MNDLKFAFRQLLKNRGFAIVAVLTLALGIGVNTSMFTALQTMMLRPLPYTNAEDLVSVLGTSSHSQSWPHSAANFEDYRDASTTFSAMAAFVETAYNLAEPGQPAERLRGLEVTSDMFKVLEIEPALGRPFTSEEEEIGKNNVVLLSHAFWSDRFSGDKEILGHTLRLNGESVTIIGVMPETLNDTGISGRVDLWRVLAFSDGQRASRGWNWLNVLGRLKRGTSLSQAQSEMSGIADRMAIAHPGTNAGYGLRLIPLAEFGNENDRLIMWLTMGLAGFVLLIACANLANLQFAKTAGRTRELAIRGALGANRRQLLKQLLSESLLIAFFGGVLGLVVAHWGNEFLNRQIPRTPDGGGMELSLNLKILGFALLATTISALTFGLLPAWMASRAPIHTVLKQDSRGTTGTRSQHHLRHTLVIAQIALALMLLAGAGVVARGLHHFTRIHPGWNVDGLTTARVDLSDSKYASEERRQIFVQTLQDTLSMLPGVERITVARQLPLDGFSIATNFDVEGEPQFPEGQRPLGAINAIGLGYFDTLGIRVISGRDFNSADTAESPDVAIINETMAERFWPGESPIGRRFGGSSHWQEVVGVVNDVRFPANLSEAETPFHTYRPYAQAPSDSLTLAIRGNVSPADLRNAVGELDPDLPVTKIGSVRDSIERSLSGPAMTGKLLSGFAIFGLLLAALGVYGVIAGFVAQRTNEIGVRMALGAQVRDVLWLVIGRGLRLTILGGVIGFFGAYGIARMLTSVSPELRSDDPITFILVTTVIVVVALIASSLPARRAMRIDPMLALRND